jgi:plasmid replication initiation protein
MTRGLAPKGDFQSDLFAASLADIPTRDQRDTMERPFFSLSKKPRLAPIKDHVGDVSVVVSPNPQFSMTTMWDTEILLWGSTQITRSLDRGPHASRTLKFPPHNLPKSIHRDIGRDHYTSSGWE